MLYYKQEESPMQFTEHSLELYIMELVENEGYTHYIN